jgi:hypothetical protein
MHVYRYDRSTVWSAAVLACLACGDTLADEPASQERDRAALRQRTKDYLDAVERGDGVEIASFWTADGDYVDEAGQSVNGRRLARQATRSREETEPRRVAVATG